MFVLLAEIVPIATGQRKDGEKKAIKAGGFFYVLFSGNYEAFNLKAGCRSLNLLIIGSGLAAALTLAAWLINCDGRMKGKHVLHLV